MMMQGDGDLDKALQKLALRLGSGTPDILQQLVGFKELGGIKEDKALMEKTIQIAFARVTHDGRLNGLIPGWGN